LAGASSRRRGGGDLGAPTSLFPFLMKAGDPDVSSERIHILGKSAAGVSALLHERRGVFHHLGVTKSVSSAEKNGSVDTTKDWNENEPQNGCVTSSDHIIPQADARQNLDRGPQFVTAGQGMSGGAGL
jgi:hypothetical protein